MNEYSLITVRLGKSKVAESEHPHPFVSTGERRTTGTQFESELDSTSNKSLDKNILSLNNCCYCSTGLVVFATS
ncbi:hypothetical protein HAPAU_09020 [Halalkalicoccus paucihalophilus]|uniref:Uncharacterized protein n=1 Tax=Halalkalicoccus paucihalophilus TaxID=1008153 RepID=A0A151AHB7_9EURY|nr:hypothetical protein HAPAU_09020 [Halalkalicoccus paucihalophilus]